MNITTLNVVSLDDGRILKKGGATPTPPSGGESDIHYIDLADATPFAKNVIVVLAAQWKISNGILLVGQTLIDNAWESVIDDIKCISLDYSLKYTNGDSLTSVGDMINQLVGYTGQAFTEITKEEFYNLD